MPFLDEGFGEHGPETNAPSADKQKRRIAAAAGIFSEPVTEKEWKRWKRAAQRARLPEKRYKELPTDFAILAITANDVYPDARAVFFPPVAGKRLETVSLITPAGQQDVAVARQSSETTHFQLQIDHDHRCRFFYDVASDDIIAYNNRDKYLHLVALQTDAADGKNSVSNRVEPKYNAPFSPGYWRIMSDEDGSPSQSMTEVLLLPTFAAVKKQKRL